jgi:hypothetical protein
LKTFHEPFASNQLGYLLIFFIGITGGVKNLLPQKEELGFGT